MEKDEFKQYIDDVLLVLKNQYTYMENEWGTLYPDLDLNGMLMDIDSSILHMDCVSFFLGEM